MPKAAVYILQSEKTGTYYIGSSMDPRRRLEEHNNGKTKATRYKGPWKLCYWQEYESVAKARSVEYQLKRFKSKKIIEQILKERHIKL